MSVNIIYKCSCSIFQTGRYALFHYFIYSIQNILFST